MAKHTSRFNKKNNIFLKILSFVVFAFLCLILIGFIHTQIVAIGLRNYIKSFEAVKYDYEQIVPTKEEEGFYTFRTDRDLKVMELTDLHIGAGRWSYKKDKKTVYEIMTMVQKEKPDLVILNGDNTFCVPGPMYHGGGTFNNKMGARQVISIFETLGVYWTTTFGNHDTEVFDFYNRKQISDLYESDKYKYCIFESNFDDYGESNQCILVKNMSGKITKALMLIDSNAYIDNSISAVINWKYDVVHDNQVEWAKNTINSLSEKNGEKVKSIFFEHIPVGEFETAYRELSGNDFNDTANTKYISGVWDELIDENMGGRIWYGGCYKTDVDPNDQDKLFEELGPDGIDSMEAMMCGHDHVNNAVVEYKGVKLMYSYSLDNLAYNGINEYGIQRGAVVFNIKNDGSWTYTYKNCYKDYGADPNKFYKVNTEDYFYDGVKPDK